MTNKQAEELALAVIKSISVELGSPDDAECPTIMRHFTQALLDAHAAGRREAIAEVLPTIEFYASRASWKQDHWVDVAREVIADDCGNVEGYAAYCGGKRARALLVKLQKEST